MKSSDPDSSDTDNSDTIPYSDLSNSDTIPYLTEFNSDTDNSIECNEMATPNQIEELLQKYAQQRRITGMEPQPFGGTINESARDWIRKFNNYTKLNKVQEDDKLIMFETLLTKSAQCWYDNLEADVKKQWDSVQKKFEDTYFNTNSWFNSQRVESRKLRHGESCNTYINSMFELSQLTGLSDVELCKAILRGLPDKLRFQVISHNPQTLEETIQRILLSESMMAATGDDPSILCSMEDRVFTSKLDNFTTKLNSTLEEIEKSCKSLKASVNNENISPKPVYPRCGVCNKNNHSEERCFYKQRTYVPRDDYDRGAYRGSYNNVRRNYYPRQSNYQQQRQYWPRPQYIQNGMAPMRYYEEPVQDVRMDCTQDNGRRGSSKNAGGT